jgi:hypothetical protein
MCGGGHSIANKFQAEFVYLCRHFVSRADKVKFCAHIVEFFTLFEGVCIAAKSFYNVKNAAALQEQIFVPL